MKQKNISDAQERMIEINKWKSELDLLVKGFNKRQSQNDRQSFQDVMQMKFLVSKIYGHKKARAKRIENITGIPRSTLDRYLRMEFANNRTWNLIKSHKISMMKVAHIITKESLWKYQDEILDTVIAKQLTQNQASKYVKAKYLQDKRITKDAEREILSNFTNSYTAHDFIVRTVTRTRSIKKVPPTIFSERHRKYIVRSLRLLINELEKYIREINEIQVEVKNER